MKTYRYAYEYFTCPLGVLPVFPTIASRFQAASTAIARRLKFGLSSLNDYVPSSFHATNSPLTTREPGNNRYSDSRVGFRLHIAQEANDDLRTERGNTKTQHF